MVNLGRLQVGNFVNWEDAQSGPVLRLQKTHAGRAVWVDLTEQEVYLLQSFLDTYVTGLEETQPTESITPREATESNYANAPLLPVPLPGSVKRADA